MEIEFAQNQKRSWYCTKINLQIADINAGINLMRKATNQVDAFLEEKDRKQSKHTIKEKIKSKKK